ncbi:MAG: MvaI/BcnI family restriction endonuclease [Bacteroidota bacterium]|nr:MvaI/BcnI family restriction endonuclease [Bacteroidota bacterium]
MNLDSLFKIFSDKACNKVYVKRLSPNDNSKNQVYLAGSFDVLNILPSGEIFDDTDGQRKTKTLKSKLDFYWISNEENISHAPNAQLILYPDYPEVRFSGFLKGSKNAPSELLASRLDGRILFLGVSSDKKIYGFVVAPEAELANEFLSLKNLETHGVFSVITILNNKIIKDSKTILLSELKRIHNLGWIPSKRLNPQRELVPCLSSNCGGYTLEAELDIPSNSVSGPDFLGWEIKQFRAPSFNKFGSTSITLMDHSPTDGYFYEKGAEAFIRKYGYADRKGRASRINFGGTHKYDIIHKLTSLKLVIDGFNTETRTMTKSNAEGYVALVDNKNNLAASWSFKSIIDHWKAKHPQACYVPSKIRKGNFDSCTQQYSYGNNIILGSYTDVNLFLYELCLGNIFYDPGIKLEMAIEGERGQTVKVRSVFRTKPKHLSSLYYESQIIDVNQL